jgi:hypothetical protein
MQALHSLQAQLDAEHAILVEKVEQMKKNCSGGSNCRISARPDKQIGCGEGGTPHLGIA